MNPPALRRQLSDEGRRLLRASLCGEDEFRDDVFYAAKRGDVAAVRAFAAEPGFDANAEDIHGRTALYAACLTGHRAVLELLLQRGAVDLDGTAYIAALRGHGIEETLRAHGFGRSGPLDRLQRENDCIWAFAQARSARGSPARVLPVWLVKHVLGFLFPRRPWADVLASGARPGRRVAPKKLRKASSRRKAKHKRGRPRAPVDAEYRAAGCVSRGNVQGARKLLFGTDLDVPVRPDGTTLGGVCRTAISGSDFFPGLFHTARRQAQESLDSVLARMHGAAWTERDAWPPCADLPGELERAAELGDAARTQKLLLALGGQLLFTPRLEELARSGPAATAALLADAGRQAPIHWHALAMAASQPAELEALVQELGPALALDRHPRTGESFARALHGRAPHLLEHITPPVPLNSTVRRARFSCSSCGRMAFRHRAVCAHCEGVFCGRCSLRRVDMPWTPAGGVGLVCGPCAEGIASLVG